MLAPIPKASSSSFAVRVSFCRNASAFWTMAISRSWLDHVKEVPHQLVDHYKSPVGYRDWLSKRLEIAPNVGRYRSVWKPHGQAIWPNGEGPLCLIYEEISDGLDGSEFTRYWLLSDHWSLHHAPCIENLLAVVAVARSLGIWVLGCDIPVDLLRQLDAGKKLIPEVERRQCGKWHPEDLVEPLPGQDTEWRKGLWDGAQAYLAADGIVISKFDRQPSNADEAEPVNQQLSG